MKAVLYGITGEYESEVALTEVADWADDAGIELEFIELRPDDVPIVTLVVFEIGGGQLWCEYRGLNEIFEVVVP